MADIFDEVSEELKQDKIVKFWKQYLKYIISILVIIILMLVFYQVHSNWNQKKIEASSKQFFNALEKLENKKYEESSKIFLKSSNEQNKGYKILSIFGLAESNFNNGKIQEMALNYKSIYENENVDLYYRNLSRMLSVMKDNISSYEHQKNILSPILNSPSKLQILAAELEVMLLFRFGKLKEANTKLNVLLKRSDISNEQKSRIELINKIYHKNAN